MKGYASQIESMLGFNGHFRKNKEVLFRMNINWDRKNADVDRNDDVTGIFS